MRHEIYLKSGYLSPEQVRAVHLRPSEDIQATIEESVGRHGGAEASVCVLPQGPQTIPYVRA
jgi:hypothetical protein